MYIHMHMYIYAYIYIYIYIYMHMHILQFFRVTPEYRAENMVCDVIPDDESAVPGEQICLSQQEKPNGMKFFIVPSAMVNRVPVVNMPSEFERPDNGYGPIPHYGLRSWDQSIVPNSPREWNDIPIFMRLVNL